MANYRDENCALLGYYAASSGNFLPTFRGHPIGRILRAQEGTDRLSRNVGKGLHLLACSFHLLAAEI
jgi:hypothetical protein